MVYGLMKAMNKPKFDKISERNKILNNQISVVGLVYEWAIVIRLVNKFPEISLYHLNFHTQRF
jgi:hypothetical protein